MVVKPGRTEQLASSVAVVTSGILAAEPIWTLAAEPAGGTRGTRRSTRSDPPPGAGRTSL